jgi:hypothetical protein
VGTRGHASLPLRFAHCDAIVGCVELGELKLNGMQGDALSLGR